MNQKKKKIFLILSLISLVAITLGITYAFFNYVKEGLTENSITTGKITFIYEEIDRQGAGISITNAFPMSDELGRNQEGTGKVFHFTIKSNTVTNTRIPYTVTARVSEKSDLDKDGVKISLKDQDTKEILQEEVFDYLEYADFETIPMGVEEKILYEGTVPAGTVGYQKNFELRMWIPDYIDFSPYKDYGTGEDIYPYNNKTFQITVNVYAEGKINEFTGPVIQKAPENSYYGTEKLWQYQSDITKIVFQDEIQPIEGAKKWDISANEDESVMAYYDEENTTAYIQANGKVIANPDSSNLFANFTELTEIEGLENFDISKVTNMSSMFSGTGITNLDAISGWDVSHVINMSSMFSDTGITNLSAISDWKVNNVTDMSWMFSGTSITNLDAISGWDVSHVTDMSGMFSYCGDLITLNLSGWNVSNVTNMSSMFTGCSSLVNLEGIGGWDVSHVINMSSMFSNTDITNLSAISDWKVNNVTDMSWMFSGTGITNLSAISDWKVNNVTDMSWMFSSTSITNLDAISGWDVSHVINMSSMFSSCSNLISVGNLSGWNVSNVTDMSSMFYSCDNLTTLDLSNWDTSNATNMGTMFRYCSNLNSVDLSNWDVSHVTDMSFMFYYCSQLTDLEGISSWDVSNVTNMSYMFDNCSNLSSVGDLSEWDVSNVTNMHSMFNRCASLSTTINIYVLPSTIYSSYSYDDMFDGAATNENAMIKVNYISENEDLVKRMINTKSSDSHVELGEEITPYTVTVNGNEDIETTASTTYYYSNQKVALTSKSGDLFVTSFQMNGEPMSGYTFKMPEQEVNITEIKTVHLADCDSFESEHNPYSEKLESKVYGEKTYAGAKSLTVILNYGTVDDYDFGSDVVWINGRTYSGYGNEIITIVGDSIKIIFSISSHLGNYDYGFKAVVIPNYE